MTTMSRYHFAKQSFTRPLALDMYEAEGEVVVKAALPGFSENDVDGTVENSNITIRARRPEAKAEDANIRWAHRELRAGEYARSSTLSNGLQGDKAEAFFSDGILTLRISKAEAARPRQIKITAK